MLLVLSRVDAASEEALAFARGLRGAGVRTVHVSNGANPGLLEARWSELSGRELEVIRPNGSAVDALAGYLADLTPSAKGFVNVVIRSCSSVARFARP